MIKKVSLRIFSLVLKLTSLEGEGGIKSRLRVAAEKADKRRALWTKVERGGQQISGLLIDCWRVARVWKTHGLKHWPGLDRATWGRWAHCPIPVVCYTYQKTSTFSPGGLNGAVETSGQKNRGERGFCLLIVATRKGGGRRRVEKRHA